MYRARQVGHTHTRTHTHAILVICQNSKLSCAKSLIIHWVFPGLTVRMCQCRIQIRARCGTGLESEQENRMKTNLDSKVRKFSMFP